MEEFDINKYEDVKEILFDTLKINEEYCFAIPYFSQRLKEQFNKDKYIILKGNLIKGKLNNRVSGDLCEIHLPNSIFKKLGQCAKRNSKEITTYDVVKLSFIKHNQRNWEVLQLEVKNV